MNSTRTSTTILEKEPKIQFSTLHLNSTDILEQKVNELSLLFEELSSWQESGALSRNLFSWKDRTLTAIRDSSSTKTQEIMQACIKELKTKVLISPIVQMPLQDPVLCRRLVLVDSKGRSLGLSPVTTPLTWERKILALYQAYSSDVVVESHDLASAVLDWTDSLELPKESLAPPSKKEKSLIQELEWISEELNPENPNPNLAIREMALEALNQWILDANDFEKDKIAEQEQKMKEEIAECARKKIFEDSKAKSKQEEQKLINRLTEVTEAHKQNVTLAERALEEEQLHLAVITSRLKEAEEKLASLPAKIAASERDLAANIESSKQSLREYKNALDKRYNSSIF